MPAHKLPKRNFRWTSELAYAVGLITTDGNLSKDKRHISLTSSDIDLLKTFKRCLNLKVKIGKNPSNRVGQKQSFRVQFGNVQLYNWLTKVGLCANKTFKVRSISVPDGFFPDFIRGHLDGDGSIITYIDKYNTNKNPKYVYERLMVYLMSASFPHVLWLQKRIEKLARVHGSIQIKKHPQRKRSCYVLKFSKKESIFLLKWIYYQKRLPCLKRKYEIAKIFLDE